MRILAIESSCDDTSGAVIENSQVISNIISSQHFHKKYGGIIPELASRAHLEYISRVVKTALESANVSIEDMDAIAVTIEPGLIGSLIVGANFAKGLSLKYNIPVIPVNHIEGHLFSGSLQDSSLEFPYVAMVVSGGHTSLFYVKSFSEYHILGSTVDDAAGEAFDKIATMVGLSYPGGPVIDKYGALGNPKAVEFPRSMINSGDYNFSFSGLKTSVRYYLAKNYPTGLPKEMLNDICASAQEAIVDVLVKKSIRAALEYKAKNIIIAGGVSANSRLRNKLNNASRPKKIKMIAPEMNYCVDNAAMIGFIAEKKVINNDLSNFFDLSFTVSSNPIRAVSKKRKK